MTFASDWSMPLKTSGVCEYDLPRMQCHAPIIASLAEKDLVGSCSLLVWQLNIVSHVSW